MLLSISFITFGILLIWVSSERLEKYSVASSKKLGISPFLIGSTVIAFGTSSPEIFTSFFAAIENKGSMVIGNVIGSNVANLSLVFGSTVLILSFRKEKVFFKDLDSTNLIILLISTFLVIGIIIFRPFSLLSSSVLLIGLIVTISYWYHGNISSFHVDEEEKEKESKFVFLKLIFSIIVLIAAAWLITQGALNILLELQLGELFVGYTVLAIGTSLPEIAASLALALKGRHEAVAGTLIGSNIFNGLFVLAIPGLMNRENIMSLGWNASDWFILLGVLLATTVLFAFYLAYAKERPRMSSMALGLVFLSIYFLSLEFAFK